MSVDLHQHLWPAPFIAALRARHDAPRLDGWTLHLPGERPFAVDPLDHDVDRRIELARADGDELVGIAPAASMGLDRLPAAEAAELAEIWLGSALELPAPFKPWAMAGEPEAVRSALDRGSLGLEIGADLLSAPDGLDRLAPQLATLEAAEKPLLVHPGPAGGNEKGRPDWWAPVVPYVTQLHAAWWAWVDGGRERFPRLPVCFVALAGLGALHGERHRARGGPARPVDPLTFVETSSYGTQAIDAVIRVLGIDVVVHGSDRPYAAVPLPALGSEAALHAIRATNPGRLLGLQEVFA